MTSLETPLPEIAHLLPPAQAERIGTVMNPRVQMTILSEIRFIVVKWEQSGVKLDPITFSSVLGPVADNILVSNLALAAVTGNLSEG